MAAPHTHTWTIQPTCGAEVNGLPLGNLTPPQLAEVTSHFTQHGVVYFRNIGANNNTQPLTNDEHISFAQHFGTININRYFQATATHPQIAKVEKQKTAQRAIGDGFHTDHSYEMAPALGSILVAREMPAEGGDTVFVDMSKAYESLPLSIKDRINSLRAVHSSYHIFGRVMVDEGSGKSMYNDVSSIESAQQQCHTHPVVIRHPTSGKNVLFVNPGFTTHFEGMTESESQELLEVLYTHAVQPAHMFRFKWSPNSAVMWDNRAVWHCAMNDYPGQHRLMNRITINGSLLQPAFPALCQASCETPIDAIVDPYDRMNVWPNSIFDVLWLQTLQKTLTVGMHNLNYTGPQWWEYNGFMRMAARAAAVLGIRMGPPKVKSLLPSKL